MTFVKGVSGNPGGRARTRPLTDDLKAELDKSVRGNGEKTKRRALIERLVGIALTGKRAEAIAAMKLIFSYTDGLPVQPIELEVKRAAEQFAARTGADPDWLVRRAQEIAQAAGAGAEV